MRRSITFLKLSLCFGLSSFVYAGNEGECAQEQTEQSPAQQNQQQDVDTLADLKAKCHEAQSKGQIGEFTTELECKQKKTFYKRIGEENIPFGDESTLQARFVLKEGMAEQQDTTWVELPGKGNCGSVECPTFEQWEATAKVTKTFRTCEDLDGLTDLKKDCETELQDTWNECSDEMLSSSSSQSSSSQSDSSSSSEDGVKGATASQCHFEPLGVVKSCSTQAPTQQQQQSGTKIKVELSSSSFSVTDSSSAEEVEVGAKGVGTKAQNYVNDTVLGGASVSAQKVTAKHLLNQYDYDVVVVHGTPAAGSACAKLGLRDGAQVKKIGHHKIKTVEDFVKYTAESAAERIVHMTVKYGDNPDAQFETYRVTPRDN